VVAGTPEDVAAVDASYTGQFLRAIVGEAPVRAARRKAA
jgi:excinuclease UvrABC ATPase subunit